MPQTDLIPGRSYWIAYKGSQGLGKPQVAEWSGEPFQWRLIGYSTPSGRGLQSYQVLEGPLEPPSLPQDASNAPE